MRSPVSVGETLTITVSETMTIRQEMTLLQARRLCHVLFNALLVRACCGFIFDLRRFRDVHLPKPVENQISKREPC